MAAGRCEPAQARREAGERRSRPDVHAHLHRPGRLGRPRSGYVAHQILLSRGNRPVVEAAVVTSDAAWARWCRQGHASPITIAALRFRLTAAIARTHRQSRVSL